MYESLKACRINYIILEFKNIREFFLKVLRIELYVLKVYKFNVCLVKVWVLGPFNLVSNPLIFVRINVLPLKEITPILTNSLSSSINNGDASQFMKVTKIDTTSYTTTQPVNDFESKHKTTSLSSLMSMNKMILMFSNNDI